MKHIRPFNESQNSKKDEINAIFNIARDEDFTVDVENDVVYVSQYANPNVYLQTWGHPEQIKNAIENDAIGTKERFIDVCIDLYRRLEFEGKTRVLVYRYILKDDEKHFRNVEFSQLDDLSRKAASKLTDDTIESLLKEYSDDIISVIFAIAN